MPLLTFLCLSAVAVDGDTLRCRDIADAGGRVRIARIDAPERGDPDGPAAQQALAALIAGRAVRCKLVDADPRVKGHQPRDRFGRIVARCVAGNAGAGGVALGPAMLASGHAEVWPKAKRRTSR